MHGDMMYYLTNIQCFNAFRLQAVVPETYRVAGLCWTEEESVKLQSTTQNHCHPEAIGKISTECFKRLIRHQVGKHHHILASEIIPIKHILFNFIQHSSSSRPEFKNVFQRNFNLFKMQPKKRGGIILTDTPLVSQHLLIERENDRAFFFLLSDSVCPHQSHWHGCLTYRVVFETSATLELILENQIRLNRFSWTQTRSSCWRIVFLFH